ncbi:MAG: FG-GAP-like repeat-containing protein [Myxococcota bacterium]
MRKIHLHTLILQLLLAVPAVQAETMLFSALPVSTFAPGSSLNGSTQKGGLLFADLNNDLLPDLVLLNDGTKPAQVLQNLGPNSSGVTTFTEIIGALDGEVDMNNVERWATGSLVGGDYDNDGDIDLFATDTRFKGAWVWENNLYANGNPDLPSRPQAPFSFTLVTDDIGLGNVPLQTLGIALLDADADGDLDLLFDSPNGFRQYYVNTLDEGNIGFAQAPNGTLPDSLKPGSELGVVDLNGDSYPDIFSRSNSADGLEVIGLNNGGGAFADGVASALLSLPRFSTYVGSTAETSSAFADYDNDGDWDLVIQNPNLELNGSVYATRFLKAGLTDSKLTFSDINSIGALGVLLPSDGSNLDYGGSVLFGDLNLDGRLDLYMGLPSDGDFDRLYLAAAPLSSPSVVTYSDVSSTEADFKRSTFGESDGAALVDWDLDGDLDLYVNNSAIDDTVLINNTSSTSQRHHYLRVRVLCTDKQRDCIGATVQLYQGGVLDSNHVPGAYTAGYPKAVTLNSTAYGLFSTRVLSGAFLGQRQVEGTGGLGAQASFLLHFAVPDPLSSYTLRVLFPGRVVKLRDVRPSTSAISNGITTLYQTVVISDSDPTDDGDGLPLDEEPLSSLAQAGQDLDSDDDGLLDLHEKLIYGTDPCNADTDADGITDGVEVGNTSSLPDMDGAGDLRGTDTGSSHFAIDSDPLTVTNPLAADSDGDGLSDGTEDANHDGKVNNGETDPTAEDSDNDGCPDGLSKDDCLDEDLDGLINIVEETVIHSDPLDADTDDDGVLDGLEQGLADRDGDGYYDGWSTAGYRTDSGDSDGDGLNAVLDPDSDNDGVLDGTELGLTENSVAFTKNPDGQPATNRNRGNFVPDADSGATTTSPSLADTDGDGIDDGAEDPNHNGRIDSDELDPNAPDIPEAFDVPGVLSGCFTGTVIADADCDGLTDAEEKLANQDRRQAALNANSPDSDGDGLMDGQEDNWNLDTDGDGLINARDPDSDNDGLPDGLERGRTTPVLENASIDSPFMPDGDPRTTTSMVNADTDFGGTPDGAEDPDLDGVLGCGTLPGCVVNLDPRDASDDVPLKRGGQECQLNQPTQDLDCDGLVDLLEEYLGLSPHDADSDDDGIEDGDEHNFSLDTDRDGFLNAFDCDADGDLLQDGLELGKTSRPSGGRNPLQYSACFSADEDISTLSFMLDVDTDGGGEWDASEDSNRNGKQDASESSPLTSSDDGEDSDQDGLRDVLESPRGLNSSDADSDDDGVLDGLEGFFEVIWSDDSDNDGLINALDPDSDNDGLLDGTELGLVTRGLSSSTELSAGHFHEDLDRSSRTDPTRADSDGDGNDDGAEDPDHDGDSAEHVSPNLLKDSDEDGLTDEEEKAFGTNFQDQDSDDDGVLDGEEHNWSISMDGDNLISALDEDSDDDLVFDGTEQGINTRPEDTDTSKGHFQADADPNSRTYMLVPDSDEDGFLDGEEDCNHNGKQECYETSPLDALVPSPGTEVSLCDDADEDGLYAYLETQLQTSATNADTDGDTIPDGVEAAGTSCEFEGVDTDGDKIPNPLDTDSDGDNKPGNDRLLDAQEVGPDPSRPRDTDGDGQPDYRDLDSDNDGLLDTQEVYIYNTDPYNALDPEGGVRLAEDGYGCACSQLQADPQAAPGGAGMTLALIAALGLLRRRAQRLH